MRRHFIAAFDHLCPGLELPADNLQSLRIKEIVITESIARKPTLVYAVAPELRSRLAYFGGYSLGSYLDEWLRVV